MGCSLTYYVIYNILKHLSDLIPFLRVFSFLSQNQSIDPYIQYINGIQIFVVMFSFLI